MKTGETIARERGLKFEDYKDGVPAEAFAKVGLPLVVHCTECGETMAFPACFVDRDGRIWCEDCGLEPLDLPGAPSGLPAEDSSDPLLSFMVGLVASIPEDEREAAFDSPEWLAIDVGKRREFLELLDKELFGRKEAESSVRG